MKAGADSTGARNAPVSPIRITPQQAEAAGVRMERHPSGDYYIGAADALVSLGLVAQKQFPGINPEVGRVAATFYAGKLVPTRKRVRHDENWLNITRVGKKFEIRIGIPSDERARRIAEDERKSKNSKLAGQTSARANPENLREAALRALRELAWLIADHTPGDHKRSSTLPPYLSRFEMEEADEFDELWGTLAEIEEWLGSVTIKAPDPLAEKAQAARQDKAFQAFLAAQCLGGA
jgi:hypothetical protein